jgi:beta-galactosidase/beta-glucuronidase
MIIRDLNHPSIIFWDNGNEGGTNKELDKEFVKWDYSQTTGYSPASPAG